MFSIRNISPVFTKIFSWKVLSVALVFVNQVMLARVLPLDQFGLLIFATSVSGFLVLFLKLGVDNSALRFIAEYNAGKRWGLFWGFSIFSAILFFAMLTLLWLSLTKHNFHLVFGLTKVSGLEPLLVSYSAGLALQTIFGSFLVALRYPAVSEFSQNVLRPSVVTAVLIVIFACDVTPSIAEVLAVYICSTIISVTVIFLTLREKLRSVVRWERPGIKVSAWLSSSAALFLTGGLYLMHHQADVILLGVLTDNEQLAYYGVASRLASFLGMGLAITTMITAPKVASEVVGENATAEMQAALDEGIRETRLFVSVTGLSLTILGYPILLIFGSEFSVALVPFLILLLGHAICSFAGPAGQILAMLGKHWLVGSVLCASSFVNITLNTLLIPSYGAIGASIATGISLVLFNVLMVLYLWRNIGLNTTFLQTQFLKSSAILRESGK